VVTLILQQELFLILQRWLRHPITGTCAHPSAVITLILQQDPAIAGANLQQVLCNAPCNKSLCSSFSHFINHTAIPFAYSLAITVVILKQ
jgi:hypothetical protein